MLHARKAETDEIVAVVDLAEIASANVTLCHNVISSSFRFFFLELIVKMRRDMRHYEMYTVVTIINPELCEFAQV